MLMNYHEMTMEEASNNPQKKKQFAVICAVITTALVYTVMTSGLLAPITAERGIFPGGNFCYKLAYRDYAASLGLGRRITTDVLGKENSPSVDILAVEETLYHLYLDDPRTMGGRRQRWATGILVGDSEQPKIDHLLAINNPTSKKAKSKRYPTKQESLDLSAKDVLIMLPYEVGDLPSVDALVVQFPHSHGFASALVLSYKVIPALRKMAVEQGEEGTIPLVLATCRKKEDMCTLYAPLVQSQDFLLGQKDSITYLASMPKEQIYSWEEFKQGGRKVFPFWKEYIDKLP